MKLEDAIIQIAASAPRELLTHEQITSDKKEKLYRAIQRGLKAVGTG
jgi:hypothetical protein